MASCGKKQFSLRDALQTITAAGGSRRRDVNALAWSPITVCMTGKASRGHKSGSGICFVAVRCDKKVVTGRGPDEALALNG